MAERSEQTSKIEQAIDDLENYLSSCKLQFMSSTNIIVNTEDVMELVNDLRRKAPDEIRRYRKIIQNQEAILADAHQQAEQILKEAAVHTSELVNEQEIMRQAYEQAEEIVAMANRQAQEIIDQATIEANQMRDAATVYTDDQLAGIEDILTHSIETASNRYENLLRSLNETLEIVTANRAQLYPVDAMAEIQEENAVDVPVARPKPNGGDAGNGGGIDLI
ncbi:MAG: vacuolar family H+-ATPase subunit H [Lachnospiraceae bacterium]|nr:vacuolar family H+-ATPase subunit H [Lachnospiraceae bacterium]